jgi:hypothetical protein
MPSPFPGMDPYLEGPERSSVHGQLIAEIGRQLAPRLRPRYVARMQKWFAVDSGEADEAISVGIAGESTGEVYPDVGIVRDDTPSGGAMATISAPLELQTVMPRLVPQHTLEIRHVTERRLVTAIEMLSPSNKRGEGYEQYRERRLRFLCSSAHLVEIDLVRRGTRAPMRQTLPSSACFIFVSRAGQRPKTLAWPASLRKPLPCFPVPLLAPDEDVLLDLQRAFTNVYDLLAYDLSTDYTRPPESALGPADRAWVMKRLKTWRAGRG